MWFCYINIVCKKYGIKPNFCKKWFRPTLVLFLAFLKEIATTGSSQDFPSPEPNGQDSNVVVLITACNLKTGIVQWLLLMMKVSAMQSNHSPLFLQWPKSLYVNPTASYGIYICISIVDILWGGWLSQYDHCCIKCPQNLLVKTYANFNWPSTGTETSQKNHV